MSYLLGQIFICLLIAGLIGAVIGWLLRGGCSKRIRDCEEEWKMKVGSLESEYQTRLEKEKKFAAASDQTATLKRHAEHVASQEPRYSYEQELQEKLKEAQKEASKQHENTKTTVEKVLSSATEDSHKTAAVDTEALAALLTQKGINLSPQKIKLYAENGIDFENMTNLEDSYPVDTIEGIGPKYAERLQSVGIATTADLQEKLLHKNSEIETVAKELNLQPDVLASWASMADLIKLPGVDAQSAEILQTVGISSATELGITNANSLHSEMVTFNKKSPIVPQVPSVESLSLWSKIAKALG